MRRRSFLGLMALPFASARASSLKAVKPGPGFIFPRDHGAHPDFRTEWWYITGWLDGPDGVQITFFRFSPKNDPRNKSAFNPRQILLAHAALSDPARGSLITEERSARAAFSLPAGDGTRIRLEVDACPL